VGVSGEVCGEGVGGFWGGGGLGVVDGEEGVGDVGGVGMNGAELADMKDEPEAVLKVYCWGEVVGEVWNVIFLGTGKKVRGSGARWVGMREKEKEAVPEVVVWMK